MDKAQVLEELTYIKRNMLALLEDEEGRYANADAAILIEDDLNDIAAAVCRFDEGAINDGEMGRLMVAQLQNDYSYALLEAEKWVRVNRACVVSYMWDAYSDYINKNVDYSEEDEE